MIGSAGSYDKPWLRVAAGMALAALGESLLGHRDPRAPARRVFWDIQPISEEPCTAPKPYRATGSKRKRRRVWVRHKAEEHRHNANMIRQLSGG